MGEVFQGNQIKENKRTQTRIKRNTPIIFLIILLILGIFGGAIYLYYQSFEVQENPEIFYLDERNYFNFSYLDYSSQIVEQTDVSYQYLDGNPVIVVRLAEDDAPKEIRITQGDYDKYSIFINSPGVYKIPLVGSEKKEISANFTTADMEYHVTTLKISSEPSYLDPYPSLSKPDEA